MSTHHEANESVLALLAATRDNDNFRKVLITGEHLQVVAMTIPPGGEIGAESHVGHDQVLFFVDGHGEAILEGETTPVGPGDFVLVHDGVHHNFVNTGDTPLRIATAYAPPEHAPGTVHATKEEADAAEEE
jgi:mannose-6-phosphate isomerase-like protein (cupin superfamily)